MATVKKTIKKAPPKSPKSKSGASKVGGPVFLSRTQRLLAGEKLRDKVPRTSHAKWNPPPDHRDPIDIMEESNRGRMPELIPLRYGRMLASPFTFLRGSAALMAYDLATTPSTGLRVQACGDCHLLNFGFFATPERNLVFDLNDFDETLPAPWEWDLKRLAISFAVAARDNRFSDKAAKAAAIECARAYREHLRECSTKSPLDVWYENLDVKSLIGQAPDAEARKYREKIAEAAKQRIAEFMFPKISEEVGGRRQLIDQPPAIFHVHTKENDEIFREALEGYRKSMLPSVRVLYDRYRLEDWVVKAVGIGSVGTRCMVGLYFSAENHPLLLQFKECRPSVLEPYAGKSVFENDGERVVVGQRLMQSSSDIFLGWMRGRRGYDYFGRQLRDMKFSLPIEQVTPVQLKRYAAYCGSTLARAHAKSGDAATISGYLGKSDTFDNALGEFSLAYADQNEKDYKALVKAVDSGRVQVLIEEA
jgi:uncharacterized protein (DUF2252 family)